MVSYDMWDHVIFTHNALAKLTRVPNLECLTNT
jgi:hypothetical protein